MYSRINVTAFWSACFFFCPDSAHASSPDFSNIGQNIIKSIEGLPGLVTGIAYMIGILMAVMGIFKLKDHVDNPSQTSLKDSAINMAAGGALFSLPIIVEAMHNTIGVGQAVQVPYLNPVVFQVK